MEPSFSTLISAWKSSTCSQRAQAGEDFEALVKEYTDEGQRPDNPHPGVILITNWDAPLLPGSVQRDGVATSFADLAFALQVHEIGLAKYHPGNSPFGWHVIKRLE
jgi:parvulin-like peptidyl-prolyl isomerase